LPWHPRQCWTFSETEGGDAVTAIGRDSNNNTTAKTKNSLTLIVAPLLSSFFASVICPLSCS